MRKERRDELRRDLLEKIRMRQCYRANGMPLAAQRATQHIARIRGILSMHPELPC